MTKLREIRRSDSKADAQFSYDDNLLTQGKYKEWFYQGMDAAGLAYLRVPAKVLAPPEAEKIFKNKEFPQVKRWRDEAACKDADPVVFFSEGSDEKHEYMLPEAPWRKYCPQCPVREMCLELARKSDSVGIFGGKLFVGGPGNSTKPVELDEETMPQRGRPATYMNADPSRIAKRVRDKKYRERRKANARVSTA